MAHVVYFFIYAKTFHITVRSMPCHAKNNWLSGLFGCFKSELYMQGGYIQVPLSYGIFQGSLTMKWALRSGLLAVIAILFAGNVKADTVVVYTLTVGSTTVATFNVPQFPATDPSTALMYS